MFQPPVTNPFCWNIGFAAANAFIACAYIAEPAKAS